MNILYTYHQVDTSKKGRNAERIERCKEREKSSFFAQFDVDITSGVVAPPEDEENDDDEEMQEDSVSEQESSVCSVVDDIDTDAISELTESSESDS